MIRRLFPFLGGVHPPQHKELSTGEPVQLTPLPSHLVLPLQQHIGNPAEPMVEVGQPVLKGQKIAKAVDYVSAPLHAPTSGTVRAIELRAVPHPSGMQAMCIVIEPDGRDQWVELKPHAQDYRSMEPSALRNLIREAGIVGLGGAGFPSFIKLNPGPRGDVETLILNGSECEPYITCDDMLMRERADEIVAGLMILRYALQAKECVIAIEDNKPVAIDTIRKAIAKFCPDDVSVVEIPTIYPAGGEKQLIHTITGKAVPSDSLPIHIGVICHNVGTAAAIYRAINHGEPLISRYITITGDVVRPRNMEVLIGTPLAELIHWAGDVKGELRRVIMGGPMMGFALHVTEVPAIKTTNCVLVDAVGNRELVTHDFVMPCIRCGSCADVCPVSLLPQQMYWHARSDDFEKLQEYSLFDCIECGCCDYVCPSHIPLVQYYRYAKAEIWHRERERKKSDIARERHEFRLARIEREKQERAARHKAKKAALKDEKAAAEAPEKKPAVDAKQAAILAAMERVKAKKDAKKSQPQNTENLTEEQQRMIDEVDRRRARQRKEQADQVSSDDSDTPENS